MTEKVLNLFRVVIPSWRFFDELGNVTHLYYRYGPDRAKLGPWILYSEKPKRNLGTLFLNPQGNLRLANIALISNLPASQRLVENLVRWEIARTCHGKFFFQFKADEYLSHVCESADQ